MLTGTLGGAYTPTGERKIFFTMIGAFAELERDFISERTMAGLAAARAQRRTGEKAQGDGPRQARRGPGTPREG